MYYHPRSKAVINATKYTIIKLIYRRKTIEWKHNLYYIPQLKEIMYQLKEIYSENSNEIL